ncbi:MAG: diguanylate cyclase [Verrucomicrobia bacterium]|nr:diguanylate cyclase [Verrucomicrobiota bacterium]
MPRCILLIDDDRLQFRLTEQMFRSFSGEQFELDWSATFDEGLAKLVTGAYAACLLDYQLGERDGLALIAAAVEAGCHTPIVFLTAETSENVDTAAMNAGALDYLVKSEITPRMLERSLRYAFKLGATLDQLRRLATHDELTGLLNRRRFDSLLAEEAERARRLERPLSLVLVDLDHFKKINDEHGHPAGDGVLRALAGVFRAGARSIDRVARIGGEEFALLLMETPRDAALATAERLVEAVRRLRIPTTGTDDLAITISAGVATIPTHAIDGIALVRLADQALYAAKRAGRDRVASA